MSFSEELKVKLRLPESDRNWGSSGFGGGEGHAVLDGAAIGQRADSVSDSVPPVIVAAFGVAGTCDEFRCRCRSR